jgi:hypothetical protein
MLRVGFATGRGTQIARLVRGVFDRPTSRMLISMTGVLDQRLLGLLETLGLALTGFDERARGLIRATMDWLGLRTHTPADGSGFGRGGVLLLSLIVAFHAPRLPAVIRAKRRQVGDGGGAPGSEVTRGRVDQ